MTVEAEAIWLAKAVLKLEENGYIQTSEESEELECEHLRRVAVHHARKIREMCFESQENKA